jgi:hypothetical protein
VGFEVEERFFCVGRDFGEGVGGYDWKDYYYGIS